MTTNSSNEESDSQGQDAIWVNDKGFAASGTSRDAGPINGRIGIIECVRIAAISTFTKNLAQAGQICINVSKNARPSASPRGVSMKNDTGHTMPIGNGQLSIDVPPGALGYVDGPANETWTASSVTIKQRRINLGMGIHVHMPWPVVIQQLKFGPGDAVSPLCVKSDGTFIHQ